MGAKVYCICNHKGGCAKTVTAVNLGIGLAREGRRVLLVDVDSQGCSRASRSDTDGLHVYGGAGAGALYPVYPGRWVLPFFRIFS